MSKKITVWTDKDGLPLDDVTHYPATAKHLGSYEQAAEDLYRFRAPTLLDRADPHSHLLVGLMDGTGNDAAQDPVHATNVAQFREQIRKLKGVGVERIDFEYLEGPGTQSSRLKKGLDGALGRTSLSRAEDMYELLVTRSHEIFKADPQAKLSIHLEGFSRGASQVPLLARIIDERGIPDLGSKVITLDEQGNPVNNYTRYHQPPGHTPMSVGMYDPVPTGYMEVLDRRLPGSVVSGFQISAADERRSLFPSDQIIPKGVSADGRFLNVTVAGAHSDIGGSYLRDGLGVRSFNLMTDYHNGLFSEPLLPRQIEPDDPWRNVIHRSEEGNVLFRAAPKADRASPEGQVHRMTHDYSHAAMPGDVVHLPNQAPLLLTEPVRENTRLRSMQGMTP